MFWAAALPNSRRFVHGVFELLESLSCKFGHGGDESISAITLLQGALRGFCNVESEFHKAFDMGEELWESSLTYCTQVKVELSDIRSMGRGMLQCLRIIGTKLTAV